MNGGRAGDALQRALHRLEPVALGLLGPRLHPGIVELHHVGTGREQIFDLVIKGCRIVERERLLITVVLILALLGHGERPRHRHLDPAVGVGAQELRVAHLDRMPAPDRPTMRGTMAKPPVRFEVLPGLSMSTPSSAVAKRLGSSPSAALAVGDDVEAGAFLVADRKQRRIVLRRFKLLGRDPPQSRARTRGGICLARLARSISQSGCG